MRTVPFDGIDSFDLPPGFFVSGGDPMAAFDSYWGSGRCQNRCVFCLEAGFMPGEGAPFPETPSHPRLDIGNWEPTSLDAASGRDLGPGRLLGRSRPAAGRRSAKG